MSRRVFMLIVAPLAVLGFVSTGFKVLPDLWETDPLSTVVIAVSFAVLSIHAANDFIDALTD